MSPIAAVQTTNPPTNSAHRFALSFTVGALLTREAAVAAPLYLTTPIPADRDWAVVRAQLIRDNLLHTRTESSAKRISREVVTRLAHLTDEELGILIDASPTERDLILWLAACRQYELIGEFAEEVVRERFQLLTPHLSYEHFDRFVAEKSHWHPELTELTASTHRKLRATVFRMLTEAQLINSGEIQPALLTDRLRALLTTGYPADIRFFPTLPEQTQP